ncbi:hypothetical protein HK098_003983 [Nowakowskiella sp. JEL0407]|nr:hypothetical protein HK098_003983 [Nowakowskiella sp. JEL0407]
MKDLTDKKYLYWLNPFDPVLSRQICVSSCPNQTIFPLTPTTTWCGGYKFPVYTVNDEKTAADYLLNVTTGNCAGFFYESKDVLNRCVPAALEMIGNLTQTVVNSNYSIKIPGQDKALDINVNEYATQGRNMAMQVIGDIASAWQLLVLGAGMAVLACLLWILLLRFLAKIIVWFTIIAVDLVFIGGTLVLFYFWRDKKNTYDAKSENDRLQTELWEIYALLGATCLAAFLALIFLILTIAMRNRIRIAVEIIRETSKALAGMPLICKEFPIV